MDGCSRRCWILLRSREPHQTEAVPVPNTPAGVVDGSVTSCTGKVWQEGRRGAHGADAPSSREDGEVGGRKRISLSGGPRANTGAAHLRSKNTPILILVLIRGPHSAPLSMVNTQTSRLQRTSICSFSLPRFTTTIGRQGYCPHFTGAEIKARNGEVTCPR